MFQCSCSQTRNARSVGERSMLRPGNLHRPRIAVGFACSLPMELHDPGAQSTSHSLADRMAHGSSHDRQSKCATFCEEHGSNNEAGEQRELYGRHRRDRCSVVGGNAAGISRGSAQARHSLAWRLGVGGAGARPVGRHLHEPRNCPRPALHSGWRGRTVGDIGQHRRGSGRHHHGSAARKGAPLRVIGANTTGTANYWYVLANSLIKTVKDINGKTIAYWTSNPSSRYDVFDLIKQYGLKARPTAIGGAAATFNQMSA
jgi:NMT1/THI5 like